MTVTITLDSLLRTILLVVAIIAVIVLIVLMIKIIKALKTLPSTMAHVDGIIDDVETISNAGKNVVVKAGAALAGIKQATDENRGPVRAATSFVNAMTGFVTLLRSKDDKKK